MILKEGQQPYASPEEALTHHGVKGMKWGVRNSDRTTSTRGKAGFEPVSVGIGVIYVAAVAVPMYQAVRNAQVARDETGMKNQLRTADVPWKRKPEFAKKMSVDELATKVVPGINPHYGGAGTKMNCRRCTYSYEMRRRGYDVKATKTLNATGQGTDSFKTMAGIKKTNSPWGERAVLNDAKQELANMPPHQKAQAIFNHLAEHPEGARGDLSVGWKMGGGHSVAWEIVNGKPVILDTQNGKVYRDPESFRKAARGIKKAGYTRLDNVQLDEFALRRWVSNND